jgi:hypothetical protein
LQHGSSDPLHDAFNDLLVRRGERGCSGGGSAPVFSSMFFIMSISILVARKLALAD